MMGVVSVGPVPNTAAPVPVGLVIIPSNCAEVVAANWESGLPVTPQVAQAIVPVAVIVPPVIGEVVAILVTVPPAPALEHPEPASLRSEHLARDFCRTGFCAVWENADAVIKIK